MSENPPLLRVHAQFDWHDGTRIVGNRSGLEALAAAVNRALADGIGQSYAFVGDGEGYKAQVQLLDAPWEDELWSAEPLPYIDDVAAGRRSGP